MATAHANNADGFKGQARACPLLYALGRNTVISFILFGALLGVLWFMEWLGTNYDLPFANLLRWSDPAWVVGIPASIIGVAYILTVRDPQNYTGFYAGIAMSLLLGVQFILQGGYDSAFLFFCVFIPFQVQSIVKWSRPKQDDEPFQPEFLSAKAVALSLLVMALITAVDYVLCTYTLLHDGLLENIVIKLFSGLLISSSVLANFWLIYRKTDAWFYWIAYSIAGIGLFILIGNIFSIVLFAFFLVINAMAGWNWIKLSKK